MAQKPRKPAAAVSERVALEGRLKSLEMVRTSWWQHWRELADYILPRRFRAFITPNQNNKGQVINTKIINNKPTMAARACASGLMSGTTSPSRPWFRMSVPNPDLMRDPDVQIWCDEVTNRMMRVMAGSNYYGAKATQYTDLVIFGTAPMLIYEDNDSVIHCFNPVLGEYSIAVSANLEPNTLFRRFMMTTSQLVEKFGIDAISSYVRVLYDQVLLGGRDTEIEVAHCVMPNAEYAEGDFGPGAHGLPRQFKFVEKYWEYGRAEVDQKPNGPFLRVRGFFDNPLSCPRWDVTGSDPYGRSPGMDALGDCKQLQFEERKKAQAIDKMVDPPMVADVSMKNEPASLLPGAVNYVSNTGPGGAGFSPAIKVDPKIAELKDDIRGVEKRIEDAFYNDLFLMISQLDTVRTATEIDARREEKLVMLGPALDRLQREGLARDIQRIFGIMARRGMFPEMPEAIQGLPLKIEYISLLADLQRASQTTSIERLFAFAGSVSAGIPAVLDNLDSDAAIEEYAQLLRTPPRVLADRKQKAQMRAARNQEQQQASEMQVGAEAVNAGKVLSETDVGGGQNALSAMLNGVV